MHPFAFVAIALVLVVVVVAAVALARGRGGGAGSAAPPPAALSDDAAQLSGRVKTVFGALTSGVNTLLHAVGNSALPAGLPVTGSLNWMNVGGVVNGTGSYSYGWDVFSVEVYYSFVMNTLHQLANSFNFSGTTVQIGPVGADGTQTVVLGLSGSAPTLTADVTVTAWAGSPLLSDASVSGNCAGVTLALNGVTLNAQVAVQLAGCAKWPPRVTALSVQSMDITAAGASLGCELALDLSVLGFIGVSFNVSEIDLGGALLGTLRGAMPQLEAVLSRVLNDNCGSMSVPIPFPCVQLPAAPQCLPGVAAWGRELDGADVGVSVAGVTNAECRAMCQADAKCNYAYTSGGDPGTCMKYFRKAAVMPGYGVIWDKATGALTNRAVMAPDNTSQTAFPTPLPVQAASCARVCGFVKGCTGYSARADGCHLYAGGGAQQLVLDGSRCDRSLAAPALFQ